MAIIPGKEVESKKRVKVRLVTTLNLIVHCTIYMASITQYYVAMQSGPVVNVSECDWQDVLVMSIIDDLLVQVRSGTRIAG